MVSIDTFTEDSTSLKVNPAQSFLSKTSLNKYVSMCFIED